MSPTSTAEEPVTVTDAQLNAALETWPKTWEEYNLREALRRAIAAALTAQEAEITRLRAGLAYIVGPNWSKVVPDSADAVRAANIIAEMQAIARAILADTGGRP